MIIDFHTHTFPDKIAERAVDSLSHASRTRPFSDGTVGGLIRRMEEAGIDRSVILPVATSPSQVIKVNDSSARINEEYGEAGLISFGCMHPDFPDYRSELARFEALGLRGVKLHPVYQDVALNDIRNLRIIDRAAELGLMVITHMGYDVGYPGVKLCTPAMAREVIDNIGDFVFILAHMGGWKQWEEVPKFLADTSCYLDTAFSTGRMVHREDLDEIQFSEDMLDESGFMEIYRAFGSERILFGTDSPWSDAKSEMDFIRSLPLSEDEKDDILGGNARRLLSSLR
ncbi:MAG: amidohydrolase family protein [Lachnospiraceae bacterium]|nr:amidohydrolase family protein [Lachnospiraceae bacterium]